MSDDLRHGGALDRVASQFPTAPLPWIDLSTGINPWPWPAEQADPETFFRLPTQSDIDRCRVAMADAFSGPVSGVTLVPGTEIAIRLLPKVLNPKTVAVLSPTYGDHAESWRVAGVKLIETTDPLKHADIADVVVVCNPNNPDGQCFDTDRLMDARNRLAQRGGWLIVDEAYAELSPGRSLGAHAGSEGLIVLRSTGKFFGLPGLRLGAALVPSNLADALEQLLGVWRISGPALEIGTQAYSDVRWQQATRRRLVSARQRLDAILNECHEVTGGTDLFRYVSVGNAHEKWYQLCKHGIYTRRFEWSRSHLRIGLPATPEAEARLRLAMSLER
ncbi:MAG: threonine-phosphate decarboxylase CobD [Pseudomonadota bacterium]